ncbi:MAG: hypothetical protein ACYSW8_26720 [Planctomycetota bacterium]|jgi:hypothetical protein
MRRRALVNLLILVLVGLLIPGALGASEIQTLEITDTEDDGFITASGNLIDSTALVHTSDPLMDISAFWVFHDVDLESDEKLNNATLRLRGASSLPFDADNGFTLRGMELNNLQDSWRPLPGMIKVFPRTSAYVNVNTSTWSGSTWFEIDVSSIVKEVVNHYEWDGDAVGTGDSIGFYTVAVPDDIRYFYDYSGSPSYSAELVIGFGEDPPAPPAPPPAVNESTWVYVNETVTVEINETDGTTQTIDVFQVIDYGDPEVQVVSSDSLAYFNTTKGNPNFTDWAGATTFDHQNAGCAEFIATLGDWTFLIGQNGTGLFVYYSDDEFQTWRTDRVNDDFTGLAGRGSNYGSIWADQTGASLIHLVWSTFSDWNNIVYDIVYSNFTLNPVTLNLTWSPTFFNVTENYATSQTDADIYQEQDGTIHVTWTGVNGTVNDIQQYRRRQANGTWLNAVRLSSDDLQDAFEGDVVANEDTGVAMVAWTQLQVGNWRIKWDVVFPNNTVGTVVGTSDRSISDARYVSMVNDRTTNVAHLAYQEDSDLQINYRNRTIDNSTAWSPEDTVSPGAQQHYYPSISLNEDNGTLVIIWWNQWNTQTSYEVFQIATGPTEAKEKLLDTQFRYPSNPDYFSLAVDNLSWALVWDNGTVIGIFDDYDDAIDGLEDITDPDPADPDPPGSDYPDTGFFTRFRTRLYILIIGLGCFLGPMVFLAYMYDYGLTGRYIAGSLITMLIGLGLMLAIRQI